MRLNKSEQNSGAVISILGITLLTTFLSIGIIGFESEANFLFIVGTSFLMTVCLGTILLWHYRRRGEASVIDYLNVGIQRYVLAIMMMLYGIDKLLGNFFDYQLFALDTRLADVSEFELAWFFYGKNRWQELFTGIMEFVPALFLLRRKSYFVAALILLPVTAQVVLLNLFFKIGGITFPVSLILMACNSYIIYSQKDKIIHFFRWLSFDPIVALTGTARTVVRILKGAGIALVCLLLVAKLRPAIFRPALHKKYEALVGVYNLKGIKKNGVTVRPDSLCYKDLYIERQARWNILRRENGQTEAFVFGINAANDSVQLLINKGGIGDGPDIMDTATALKGRYLLKGKSLKISGTQQNNFLELTYERQDHIRPKKWFW